MPALADIALNDGQTSPVAHTFSPASLQNGLAVHQDRSSGVALGFPVLTSSLVPPKKGSQVYRSRIQVSIPVLNTLGTNDAGITPPPSVAYFLTAKIEFTIPARSSLSERKDIIAYAKNAIADSTLQGLVRDYAAFY